MTAHASVVTTPDQIAPIDILAAFELLCWAKARLFAEGEIPLDVAVDALQEFAEVNDLVRRFGQDRVQALMSAAFVDLSP